MCASCNNWVAVSTASLVLLLLCMTGSDAAPRGIRAGTAPRLTTSLRLRGGKSRGGAPSDDHASSQGLQLPLLRNMLDLSTSLSASANGTVLESDAVAPASLDPERMAFLQNAFAEMLENNTDIFATSIARLSLPEDCEANVSLKANALSAIAERVESMDLAEGLLNMGGLQPSIHCLTSNHSIIRSRAAEVVAAAAQNLDKLKEEAHRGGALEKLIAVYADRNECHEARTKSLHAISALIKGNSTAQLHFLYNQGLAMMRCDIQIGDVRIRRKALFVLGQLLRANPLLRAAVSQIQDRGNATADKGVLPELVQVLTVGPEGAPDPQMVEFAVSAIVAVLEHPATTPGLVAPSSDLTTTPSPRAESLRAQFPHLAGMLRRRVEDLREAGATEGDGDLSEVTRLLRLLGEAEAATPGGEAAD